jgi:acetyl esterase/lipase
MDEQLRSNPMKAYRPSWLRLPFFSAVAVLVLANRPAPAEVLYKVKDIAGTTVHYQVILPNDYDPAKTYPAVLAFPGGAQTMNEVRGTLERNWRGSAERLDYIVVIPAAPGGNCSLRRVPRFFQSS